MNCVPYGDEWEAIRLKSGYVHASSAFRLLGLTAWKQQGTYDVFCLKRKRETYSDIRKAYDEMKNPVISNIGFNGCYGQALERVTDFLACKLLNCEVEEAMSTSKPDYPWIRCTPDGYANIDFEELIKHWETLGLSTLALKEFVVKHGIKGSQRVCIEYKNPVRQFYIGVDGNPMLKHDHRTQVELQGWITGCRYGIYIASNPYLNCASVFIIKMSSSFIDWALPLLKLHKDACEAGVDPDKRDLSSYMRDPPLPECSSVLYLSDIQKYLTGCKWPFPEPLKAGEEIPDSRFTYFILKGKMSEDQRKLIEPHEPQNKGLKKRKSNDNVSSLVLILNEDLVKRVKTEA